MKFTKEMPTVPGAYWRRKTADDLPDLVEVYESNIGFLLCQCHPIRQLGGEWCRLVPAEEVEKAWSEARELPETEDGVSSGVLKVSWDKSRTKQVLEGKL